MKRLNFKRKLEKAHIPPGTSLAVGIVVAYVLFIILFSPKGISAPLPEKYHDTYWVCSELDIEFYSDYEGRCSGTLIAGDEAFEIEIILDSVNCCYISSEWMDIGFHVFSGQYKIRKGIIYVEGSWSEEVSKYIPEFDAEQTKFTFVQQAK